MEKRFQMHEKLLLDVIMRQAGSVQKAVLEGVMNSIEANSSKVEVSLEPRRFSIKDNGKGFKDKEEIERWFGTFGQPHEESEKKVWAQFRMGRGQMFAFGRNSWRTGQFEMKVDIKARLGYDLMDGLPPHDGCDINVELYNPLSDRELYAIGKEVERYVKYVSIPVIVNGEQVNTPPSEKSWGKETNDAAYIRLNANGHRLEIYNLGVLVCDVPQYTHGVAGTIVSKKRLEVNFARNDVIRSCPVWRAIMSTVESSDPVQKVKNKRVLNPDERFNVIERLCSGEMDVADSRKTQLFLDVSGHPWSINSMVKADFPCWSFAPAGDMRGDRLIQSHQCLVLDEAIVRAFDCKPEDVLTHKWKQQPPAGVVGGDEGSWNESLLPSWQKLPYRRFSEVVRQVDLKHTIIPEANWTRNEWIWLRIAGEMQQSFSYRDGAYHQPRRIMLGSSESYNGWTDGHSYIAIGREFLRGLKLQEQDRPVIRSLSAVATLMLHELCHDDDSRTNVHSPEFYKAYHELSRDMMASCLHSVHSALCNGRLHKLEQMALKRNELEQEQEPLRLAADAKQEQETPPQEPPKPPTPPPPPPPPKEPEKPKAKPPKAPPPPKEPKEDKAGRTAAEITDPETVAKIAALYKGNGGTMTYEEIEGVAELDLRKANGMTAYRIIKRAEKEAK